MKCIAEVEYAYMRKVYKQRFYDIKNAHSSKHALIELCDNYPLLFITFDNFSFSQDPRCNVNVLEISSIAYFQPFIF